MKEIVGRLSELGLKELAKLLSSVGVDGTLELETADGRFQVLFSSAGVAVPRGASELPSTRLRAGSFRFRPGRVASSDWLPLETFLERIDRAPSVSADSGRPASPLDELKASLEDLPLPEDERRIVVFAADPRPYRAMEKDWERRGWESMVVSEPEWVAGLRPSALVLHVPGMSTLAGQADRWMALLHAAATASPPVPVIWVGGLNDPWIRHQTVALGAEFLLPAPLSEVGEAARWFREDVTALLERCLARRSAMASAEGEAFRDLFMALQAEADSSEVAASVLRLAGTSFRRGALLSTGEGSFAPLGVFGFPIAPGTCVARGTELLERVVAGRAPVRAAEVPPGEAAALASALGTDELRAAEVFPMLDGDACVAVLVADTPSRPREATTSLASFLRSSGRVLSRS